jgi:hypothetical protein
MVFGVGRITDRARRGMNRLRRLARYVTANGRQLPDFMIIGAQRSGTTSLYRYLLANPAVEGGLRKEPDFFNWHFGKGLRWYLSMFPSESKLRDARARLGIRPLIMEATPQYLLHPLVPTRIAEVLPEARFIVMLREPVARAFSQYRKQAALGRHQLTFEQALEREQEVFQRETNRILQDPSYLSLDHRLYSYLARGRYAEQLERWFRVFPRDRFHIICSEDFYADPRGETASVYRFLGVPEWEPNTFGRYMVAPDTGPMDEGTRRKLQGYFRPHNERLYELLGTDLGWDRAGP